MKIIITFGEIMLRLGAPDYLRLTQCDRFDVSFAGSEANVAVSLANYGLPVKYVTRLPDNPISDRCIRELNSYNVDTEFVIRGGKRIGILYLETGSNSRPSRVIYDREDSAFATICADSIDWKLIFRDAQWFHWTGITPALSENAAEVCRMAIKTANEMGLTVSCDINYRKNLWNYGKSASEVMPDLVAGCDIIAGNEEDCEKVFGIKNDSSSFLPVCQQMMERFPKCRKMAVSNRESVNANHNFWSAVLYSDGTLKQSPKYDITDIVDRVGSGDSFMGALIYGLLSFDNDDQKALDFAVAASALKHTIKGDYNQVSVEEVLNLMNGDSSGRIKR